MTERREPYVVDASGTSGILVTVKEFERLSSHVTHIVHRLAGENIRLEAQLEETCSEIASLRGQLEEARGELEALRTEVGG